MSIAVTPQTTSDRTGPDNGVPVISSFSGEVIAHVPEYGAEDVDRAVVAARRAFAGWSAETPKARGEALLEIASKITQHAEELVEIEVANTGRPRAAARDELAHTADAFTFYAGAVRNLAGIAATEYIENRTSFVRREAVGVCAQITPWNYPMMMSALALAPSLGAGNTSIIKPAELTPLSTLRIAELCAEVLPENVLTVATGRGSVTGAALTTHPDVDLVSLIGSRRAGEAIAVAAAPTQKKLHLELGGKAPVVVFPGSDLRRVAETLKVGAFNNAGQDCTAAARVIASADVVDELVALMDEVIGTITVGAPDEDAQMGPLISAGHRDRVHGMVTRAVQDGATLVRGGAPIDRPGFFYEPTLLLNPSQDSEIVQHEVFGPVLTVQTFATEEEAIALANGVEFDLAASVWSPDAGQLFRAAKALDFGTVWLNDHFPQTMETPHGGLRYSGHGKDQSVYSLDTYLRVKHVTLNLESA